MNETVALLAAGAPKLRTAVRNAKKAGHAYRLWLRCLVCVRMLKRVFSPGRYGHYGLSEPLAEALQKAGVQGEIMVPRP